MNREQEIEAEIQTLAAEREAIRSRRTWKCPHCEKRTQITKLTIIQDHFYVSPYSCSGGDYWTTSKEVFIPCPKCDYVIRICESFVQIRAVRPMQTINNDEMYSFVKEHSLHFNEHLDYYNDGVPSHDEIENIREEKRRRN